MSDNQGSSNKPGSRGNSNAEKARQGILSKLSKGCSHVKERKEGGQHNDAILFGDRSVCSSMCGSHFIRATQPKEKFRPNASHR